MQHVIILEGTDMSGKTEIAHALSRELGIPYWKCDREWSAFKGDTSYFRNTVRYGDEYFVSYLRASGASVIKDRGYPSEWVYSRAMGRPRDDEALWHIDMQYAALGATIVLCKRSSYAGISDDLFGAELGPKKLTEIAGLYEQFAVQSRCRIIDLNVDDENLVRELAELRLALGA